MVCKVLQISDFSEEIMDSQIEKITVSGSEVTFCFLNGKTEIRQYIKPKKRGTKHTEEYKEYMSKIMKAKWKEGKTNGKGENGNNDPCNGQSV